MADDPLLTVQEVAARLRLRPETVRRWLRTGRLAGISLGSDHAGWRVRESALAEFLAPKQLELPDEDVRAKKRAA
jgi:excisionase family DNA binding protein